VFCNSSIALTARSQHETIEECSEDQYPVNSNVPGEVVATDGDMDSVHMSLFLSVKLVHYLVVSFFNVRLCWCFF